MCINKSYLCNSVGLVSKDPVFHLAKRPIKISSVPLNTKYFQTCNANFKYFSRLKLIIICTIIERRCVSAYM